MEEHSRRKESGSSLAWILIIIGLLLIMKRSGWGIDLPGIGPVFAGIGQFMRDVVHFVVQIGWPVVLIIAGIMLLIGRKLIGGVILFLLLLFFLPGFILIPGILLFVFLPLILIIAGIVILTKLF